MTLFIAGFQKRLPRFRGVQKDLLAWLADAYAAHGALDRGRMRALLSRYGGAADAIATRGHELPDFSHRARRRMILFGPNGSDVAGKTRFFDDTVSRVFERFYPSGAAAPAAIVHVTCTGYMAPSPAQKLVAARRWGRRTQVLHAYHMGCYAAHPALRIAAGPFAFPSSQKGPVDVVHTELCSLHLDLGRPDPAQLVIQSLFADGHMRYGVHARRPARCSSLEILALLDEVLPNSAQAMSWLPGPLNFAMTLTKEVPQLLVDALPGFAGRLFRLSGLKRSAEKSNTVFAIHPGGPRILEWSQKALGLTDGQMFWSRRVLREHGNMSSATLPHIWQAILDDAHVPDGSLVVSVGAGPGLTLSGALFRKHRAGHHVTPS